MMMNPQKTEPVNEWNSCVDPPVRWGETVFMVRARTVELALHAGRSPLEIRQLDYERAKIELTGETDWNRQMEVLYPLA